MQKLGLIAGGGQFPLIAAKQAAQQGYMVYAIAIKEETSQKINNIVNKVNWIRLGQLSKLITFLKENEIKKVLMAGKVAHRHIFSPEKFDRRLNNLLQQLENRSGNSILKSLAELLNKEGIEVIDSTLFISNCLAPKGVLSRRKPTEEEMKNIQYGRSIAGEMVKLHIGQSVAVKKGAVVAIEAMEGTDEMILRAGKLAGKGVVIVKASYSEQDRRFDIPVVGDETVEKMQKVGAGVLAFAAKKTLIFNKENMIKKADQSGIAIVSF